jgi:hypothetical protein
MDVKQNPRRIVFFLLAVPMLLLASVAGSQELLYEVDTAASIVHQTGGGSGWSRDLTASGTFAVVIDGDQISFRNIDVEFAPTNHAPEVFPEYLGTLTGSTLAGDEHPCPTHSPSWFAGSFVDNRIQFDGYYEMCADDGFDFNYTFVAVLQPPPAVPQLQSWGVALFSISLLAIGIWIIRLRQ